jgi:aspartate/methionine/tyrosine aminotransferase
MVKRLMVERADRLYHLPPVIDDFLPRGDRTTVLGRDIIDLARFRWPKDETVTAGDDAAVAVDQTQLSELAELTSEWYRARFGARINPRKEIFFGASIRQMLGMLTLSFFNPGDLILIPDPGVWHYRAAAALASAETVPYHLTERNHFRPDMRAMTGNLIRLARGIILNSPHNPTGAVLTHDDLSQLLRLAGKNNLLLVLDQAFATLSDDNQPLSLFSLPGGRKVALELYSYAYNFGLPMPSIGFAVGQPAIIAGLQQTAAAFGISVSRQTANIALQAFRGGKPKSVDISVRFTHNREMAEEICRKLRLEPADNRTGPFCWARLPGRKMSRRFCRVLYLRCGVLAVPGMAFGENGEGYIRFSLTAPEATYQKAIDAVAKFQQPRRERKSADG